MSFFPGASTPLPYDSALTPGGCSEHDDLVSLRSHTPFTPVPSHNDEWVLLQNSDIPDFSSFQYMPWLTDEPRGLGLSTQPDTFGRSHCHNGLPMTQPSVGVSDYSWPPQLGANQIPSVHSHDIRRDSRQESCDPLSTLLPGSMRASLQPSEASMTAYDTSSGRSDYSASPLPSAFSSPYTHAGGHTPNAPSPYVKIEDTHDSMTPRFHFTTHNTPLEQSLLVNPSDLLTVPIEERIKTCLGSSTNSDAGDVKPLIASASSSPSMSEAQLSDDASASVLAFRKKRTYTKAENALCACHICGKPFQRTYNLRAHMDTHDPDRAQPNECQIDNCGKRFVRHTDLKRHQKSIHSGKRDWVCPLCDASFSRKDTLQRHVEDGCSKRAKVKSQTSRSSRRPLTGSTSNSRSAYRSRTVAQHQVRMNEMALRVRQARPR